MKIAVISLTENGKIISEKISRSFDVCSEFAYEKYSEDKIPFSSLGKLTSEIFGKFDALVFICAVGIAVRVIAPNIVSKFTDPAVVAVDESGKYVVSVLSGHIGGANALAKKIAGIIGAVPVITTATDMAGKFSPDLFAASNYLFINEIDIAKEAAAAVVNGKKIGFVSDFKCENVPDLFAENPDIGICISFDENKVPFRKTLHLIPKNYSVGIGCKKDTSYEALSEFVFSVFKNNGLSEKQIRCINSVDKKRNERCIHTLSKKLNVPVNFYSAEKLMSLKGDFSASDFVMKTVGADNVCERSACAAGGTLIVPKNAGNGVTAAVAMLSTAIDFERDTL